MSNYSRTGSEQPRSNRGKWITAGLIGAGAVYGIHATGVLEVKSAKTIVCEVPVQAGDTRSGLQLEIAANGGPSSTDITEFYPTGQERTPDNDHQYYVDQRSLLDGDTVQVVVPADTCQFIGGTVLQDKQ